MTCGIRKNTKYAAIDFMLSRSKRNNAVVGSVPFIRVATCPPSLPLTLDGNGTPCLLFSSQLCKEHCVGKYASFYAVQFGEE